MRPIICYPTVHGQLIIGRDAMTAGVAMGGDASLTLWAMREDLLDMNVYCPYKYWVPEHVKD